MWQGCIKEGSKFFLCFFLIEEPYGYVTESSLRVPRRQSCGPCGGFEILNNYREQSSLRIGFFPFSLFSGLLEVYNLIENKAQQIATHQ